MPTYIIVGGRNDDVNAKTIINAKASSGKTNVIKRRGSFRPVKGLSSPYVDEGILDFQDAKHEEGSAFVEV